MAGSPQIKFTALGGAGEIGANCYYLNIDGTGILLDSGQHPRKTGLASLPDFSIIVNADLDFVIISHAHQDHIAALPFLIKRFPYLKIIATPQTKQIAFLTLHNAVSIVKEQLKDDEELAAFDHEEVELLVRTIETLRVGEVMELAGYNHRSRHPVLLEFFEAGHILGSCSVSLDYKGVKTFYTGDINLSSQRIQAGAVLPKFKVDNLILESTNGSQASQTLAGWETESARFASSINEISVNGGSILIPVFALGKFQEILGELAWLMKKRKIPVLPIYSGGLSEKITRLYDGNRYISNFNDPDFELREIPREDLYKVNSFEELFRTPSIVLASSGMMIAGTYSFNLAKFWLRKGKGAIFTVGYMDPESPGYLIANSKKGDKIQFFEGGEEYTVACEIRKFRFSAHSSGDELIKVAEKLRPGNVFLIHGDDDSINYSASRIRRTVPAAKIFVPEKGREIILNA